MCCQTEQTIPGAPADEAAAPCLCLVGGRVVDVDRCCLARADVLVKGDRIAAVGPDLIASLLPGTTTVDVTDRVVSPGFCDAHLHIESTMVTPSSFAASAIPHGTVCALVDPHEIANVAGMKGIDLFLRAADHVPLALRIGVPSCVPATDLEDAGGSIQLEDIRRCLDHPSVYGLGEMMNVPAILHGLGQARDKVEAALAAGKLVDGHCPKLRGADLRCYITNGHADGIVRIGSCHEVTTGDEALEKIAAGMVVAVREGSAARDLHAVLPAVAAAGFPALDRCMLCTDDLDPIDLHEHGHMDRILRRVIPLLERHAKLDPERAAATAIRMCTLAPARYLTPYLRRHGMPAEGRVVPGCAANLCVLGSLADVTVDRVLIAGRLVARRGQLCQTWPEPTLEDLTANSMNVGGLPNAADFAIAAPVGNGMARVRVIGVTEGSLVTENRVIDVPVRDGCIVLPDGVDMAKLAVIERHRGTGTRSVGLVHGLGLRRGAIASTVAHDSHNLIVAGVDDGDMARAARSLVRAGGGLAAVSDTDHVCLPLPVGGLMTTDDVAATARRKHKLLAATHRLGCRLDNPFMALSFLALPVIPHLKLTNRFLVDVDAFAPVPLFAD